MMNQQKNKIAFSVGQPQQPEAENASQALTELEELVACVPAGILKCRNDAFFTILDLNDGLLQMIGYTKAEIATEFHNHLIETIHPADRQMLLDSVRTQIATSDFAETKYRLMCKDGHEIWVLDKSHLLREKQIFYCAITDVTNLHNIQEELQLSLDRHRIIMDQAADIIFEWNIGEDSLIYSANWEKKFGYSPIHEQVQKNMLLHAHIHPEDALSFSELMEAAYTGSPYCTSELRIQNATGRYIWCRIRATPQCNSNGKLLKVVGVITDIDEEKHMIESLRAKAELDGLTGLYDKVAVQTLIEKHLAACSPEEVCALLMLDIDNFKTINDTKGHLFGDAVLSDLSAGMKREIRSVDLIGRVGGDEFAILLRGIQSEEFAINKANQLVQLVEQLFTGEKEDPTISCSVGIALFPLHGKTFQQLYQCADIALYRAKNLGKNRSILYQKTEDQPDYPIPSFLGAAIDSKTTSLAPLTNRLLEYVFHTLYTTNDLDQAIPLILEVAGRQFDVSRAYVFENSDDGKYCSNTFEWCNTNIPSEKGQLQNIAYATMSHYENNFDESGIFYCRDITKLPLEQVELLGAQGVTSLLQCAIEENGRYRGFVGFDECTGLRLWTKKEIAILTLLSELLSTFLLKKRTQEKDRKNSKKLQSILDSQDSFIYAIDRDTYELLYLNQRTKDLDPVAQQGNTCYQSFFHRDTPCVRCPVHSAAQGKGVPMEFYNPQYQIWTRACASPLEWDDRNAFLVACSDITNYKKTT